ncbi:MAG: biopolymer transporter ExbD [Deltaproteobacteria bacterium]|nr:biopolymer transporter ExbD [Deltaproteobacteria bacterium]
MAFAVSTGTAKKGRRGAAVTPSMNVTPLVDVVLVLLIIFMVVTPLLVKQMSVRVPEKAKDTAPPAAANEVPIVLMVKNGGAVELNKAPIALDAIAQELTRVTAGRSDRIVFFGAEPLVTYGEAVAALDRAKSSGATVAVLTER